MCLASRHAHDKGVALRLGQQRHPALQRLVGWHQLWAGLSSRSNKILIDLKELSERLQRWVELVESWRYRRLDQRISLFVLVGPARPLGRAALPCAGRRCVIVENKLVFLTLPQLPDTLAIFGSGFQVELLAKLPWLRECPNWYWGDLDAQGFQILARLRALFPQVVSLMMDEATLEAFREFVVVGTPSPAAELPQLTPGERALFERLVHANLRLEQERISQAYVLQQIELAL